MNKKLVAGLAAAGVLAGGGTAAVLITAGGAAPATTITAVSTTATVRAGSPLAQLVANGTITRSQAAAIQNALVTYMREHRPDRGGRCAGPMGNGSPWMLASHGPLTTVLAQLVRNGTLTPSQANAVTRAFTQQMRLHWGDGPGMRGYGAGMMGGPQMGWAN